MTDARDHDLVLLGASGFVGRLVAEHVARHAPPGTRVALAGRSRARLEEVRAALPDVAHGWPVVVADSADDAALARLARSTRALLSTVGPYARHGLPLVGACAAAGTHYADLTGEVTFVRAAVDRYGAAARASGARVVHACGYDSVPSDLAVHLLHARAAADGAGELVDVRLRARARGGVSGGTVASMRGVLDDARRSATTRRLLRDPYALSPDRGAEPDVPQPRTLAPPRRAADGRWAGPWVMASFDGQVVRRSNALTGWAYGRGLRYGEVVDTGPGARGAALAAGVAAGLVVGGGLLLVPGVGRALERVLPAPGTGPDAATRARGWFRSEVRATTTPGRRYTAVAAGPGDPGYAATAVMLGQTGLALALDAERLPDRAGSLTPATALGDVLVARLRAAGHTYAADEATPVA
ncbi:saccharopine dehydrogenase family protein [Cellulomonas iranensis]|uniref:Short subunit dehydrogenase-like uncharacterized protein n=1 Tax=Cellulomonas iranensis TaxID=76862 RepID=A0ABU0GJG4_9CELL|nr:saccharopine dehydrogenase NADP-binding domain-containing protein [Cellulomonas iranensis]MDQ0425213.1 short subunit dehydrogenase-like uncharacterized protein [Cellulomonas iranensis]